jgi:predicted dehydrogenase
MLREAKPDVVHVLTPPHTHAALVSDALNAGAHVIVEKPVAPSNAQFRQLYNLAAERGRRNTSLPHPSHNLPAGVIHEFITHLCYLALRFVPVSGEPLRIAAAWSHHGSEAIFKYDDLDALVISGPIHARIRFTSHAAPDCFTVTVRGTKGWAETDLFQPHLRVVVPRKGGAQLSPLVNQFASGATLAAASVRGFRNKVMQKTPYEGLRTFLDRTYEALVTGTEPPVTFDDMDRASRLVDALLDERNRVAENGEPKN